MRKLRADVIVTAIFLTAALLFFLVPRLFSGQEEARVEILLDGELLEGYPLSEDRTITVLGVEEGYNLVLVTGGTVKVTDADCPDQLCMKQKSISRDGESIICLPHRLIVRIQSQKESDIDAVTN